MISERPAEADDRAVPGHWEGDLIIGLDRSAIGTLVERTSRFTMLLHLPPMDGHGRPADQERPGARRRTAPRRSATRSPPRSATLPEQLRRSLTWDQGAEMAQHAQLRIDTGLAGLLLRPAQPLAARHQREHQRAAAPVLPQGHRPRAPQRRRPRRRRRRAQRPAAQDARLADPRRGPRRAPRRRGLTAASTRHLDSTGRAPGGDARAAIAAPARPTGEPPRRQPRRTSHVPTACRTRATLPYRQPAVATTP